ncbi:hypothetical protein DFH08DRAFT_805494 [Mycena albidolilacea]|uniref:Uncharacterized protein n=1 Tax=Mycena albidolilacea TaxID=1033008 RepID=A0AAD7A8Q6_9AGAR|nr:hypothetical protein DFH08DRAFT_805494 [Mycena albidolilacea]
MSQQDGVRPCRPTNCTKCISKKVLDADETQLTIPSNTAISSLWRQYIVKDIKSKKKTTKAGNMDCSEPQKWVSSSVGSDQGHIMPKKRAALIQSQTKLRGPMNHNPGFSLAPSSAALSWVYLEMFHHSGRARTIQELNKEAKAGKTCEEKKAGINHLCHTQTQTHWLVWISCATVPPVWRTSIAKLGGDYMYSNTVEWVIMYKGGDGHGHDGPRRIADVWAGHVIAKIGDGHGHPDARRVAGINWALSRSTSRRLPTSQCIMRNFGSSDVKIRGVSSTQHFCANLHPTLSTRKWTTSKHQQTAIPMDIACTLLMIRSSDRQAAIAVHHTLLEYDQCERRSSRAWLDRRLGIVVIHGEWVRMEEGGSKQQKNGIRSAFGDPQPRTELSHIYMRVVLLIQLAPDLHNSHHTGASCPH